VNKKYILLISFTIIIVLGLLIYSYQFNQASTTGLVKDLIRSEGSGFFDSRTKYTNPLTGEIIYSETKPEFLSNSPLTVMVNNAVPARPQAGLTKADIIYEIVAEGGITRFLAVYYSELPEKVGPIRSVREYYLLIVKELGDSMLMHIGYSPQALQKINEWGVKSLGLAGADFYRDNRGDLSVATEHTAFADARDLYTYGKALNFNTPTEINSWKFSENLETSNFKKANFLKIDFWFEGDYSAVFKYDSNKNEYVRYSGISNQAPNLLIDDLSKTEVRVKNVIVQFAEEFPIPNDDKGRLDYRMLGTGKALIFRDGVVIESNWKKDSLETRTTFFDLEGKEIEFNRGKFWVSVVPSRNENQVKYTE